MQGVQRARFCHNRKDVEDTYLPGDDALYRLNDGAPRDGRLDLSGWGTRDEDMPGIATVRNTRENHCTSSKIDCVEGLVLLPTTDKNGKVVQRVR